MVCPLKCTNTGIFCSNSLRVWLYGSKWLTIGNHLFDWRQEVHMLPQRYFISCNNDRFNPAEAWELLCKAVRPEPRQDGPISSLTSDSEHVLYIFTSAFFFAGPMRARAQTLKCPAKSIKLRTNALLEHWVETVPQAVHSFKDPNAYILTSLCASLFCALELARLLLLYVLVFGDLLQVLAGRFAKVGSILAAPAPHCSWRSRALVAFMPSNMQERRHF